MADLEDKKPIEETCDNISDKIVLAPETNNKRESLEDLLTTLSHHIKNSDWLLDNTADKFAAENPEVAQAFRDAALKSSQDRNDDVKGENV